MDFKEFFTDNNGRLSMQRLTTFILVVASVLIAFASVYALFTGLLITELNYLIGVLLTAGLGTKVWSKFAENKK